MTPTINCFAQYQNRTLYSVNFFGTPITVTVTSSAAVVRKWICTTTYLHRSHLGCLVVGLGVQWNPFNYQDSADTLQLCVGSRCLIFQLSLANTVPQLLRQFLLDTGNTFVGIWNGSDERMLLRSHHELNVHKLLDLRRHVATRYGESLARESVEVIVREFLGYEGVSLDPRISISEWDDDDLSDEQVLQASVKAHVAFEIGKSIRAWML